jgi:hypothetical protein
LWIYGKNIGFGGSGGQKHAGVATNIKLLERKNKLNKDYFNLTS